MSSDLFNRLGKEAERRKENTATFCARLLGQIADDDLFDAVLDEEPTGKESQ